MCPMPTLYSKISADMMEMHSNSRTSPRQSQTGDATSAHSASRSNWYQFQSSMCKNCQFAGRISLLTYISSLVRILTLDASSRDSQHDTDFVQDMLTNEGTTTGQYTICCNGMAARDVSRAG